MAPKKPKKPRKPKKKPAGESTAIQKFTPPPEPQAPPPEEPIDAEFTEQKKRDRRKAERYLPVKLTQPELREKSRALAQTVDDLAGVEARKKSANDGFKKEIDSLKGVQNSLAHMVDTGEEAKPVSCTWQGDWSHKLMKLYRDDTSVLVETRPMTETELQVEIEDWGNA